MARIAGVNIPNHKHTWVGLTSIFGIGRARAYEICAEAGITPSTKIKDLNDGDMEKLGRFGSVEERYLSHWRNPKVIQYYQQLSR